MASTFSYPNDLTATLPVLSRLALSYAPGRARLPTLVLLALDARLAGIVRGSSEPLLGQLRLAWWRDTLGKPAREWPQGEPLLQAARGWEDQRESLAGLVDGWEALLGEAPLPDAAFDAFCSGRAKAFAGLSRLLGEPGHGESAARAARGWALADLAGRVGNPEEKAAIGQLARAYDWSRARLPRSLRPLAVLHGLSARAAARGEALDEAGPGALATALRIGLAGR